MQPKLDWNDARLQCIENGGDLAQVTNQNIQSSLVIMMKALLWTDSVWIGASDQFEEGNWTWVSGDIIVVSIHSLLSIIQSFCPVTL